MQNRLAKLFQTHKDRIVYDILKGIGAAVIALAGYVVHRFGYGPEWLPYLIIFVVALAVFIWATRKIGEASANRSLPGDERGQAKTSPSSNERDNLAAYSAALNREVASLNEKLKDCEQKRQMPRPYLEVLDSTDDAVQGVSESRFHETRFLFTNRGGDVCHKVQVQPASINHYSVVFEPIPAIAINQERETMGTIPGKGVMQRHDILRLMVNEWNDRAKAAGTTPDEHSVNLLISYEDFTGAKYEAAAEVVLFPINKINHDKYDATEWMKQKFKIVEVRNMAFRRVP